MKNMEKVIDMNSVIIPTLFDLVEEMALPIEINVGGSYKDANGDTIKRILLSYDENELKEEIGRASCRERVSSPV